VGVLVVVRVEQATDEPVGDLLEHLRSVAVRSGPRLGGQLRHGRQAVPDVQRVQQQVTDQRPGVLVRGEPTEHRLVLGHAGRGVSGPLLFGRRNGRVVGHAVKAG
jgi:hypothetical protein